jgi:PAS fold
MRVIQGGISEPSIGAGLRPSGSGRSLAVECDHHLSELNSSFLGSLNLINRHRCEPGSSVGLAQIISERQELRRREHALAFAIEEIACGFCLFDSGQRLICCNAKYLSLYGLRGVEAGTDLSETIDDRLRAGMTPVENGCS